MSTEPENQIELERVQFLGDFWLDVFDRYENGSKIHQLGKKIQLVVFLLNLSKKSLPFINVVLQVFLDFLSLCRPQTLIDDPLSIPSLGLFNVIFNSLVNKLQFFLIDGFLSRNECSLPFKNLLFLYDFWIIKMKLFKMRKFPKQLLELTDYLNFGLFERRFN
jgi:hypothetical protein